MSSIGESKLSTDDLVSVKLLTRFKIGTLGKNKSLKKPIHKQFFCNNKMIIIINKHLTL